jgi:hypothetical protein
MTIVCLVLAAIVTHYMTSVGDAWKYMLTLTAGVGLVMILRWYWWRVSAWSEIAALVTSAITGSALYALPVFAGDDPNVTAKRLLITVCATTLAWLIVTFATKPESEATLLRFYERVRPDELGWAPIARIAAPAPPADSLRIALIDWVAALGLIYGTLFGIGKLILGEPASGAAFIAFALVCLTLILRSLRGAVRPAAAAPTLS